MSEPYPGGGGTRALPDHVRRGPGTADGRRFGSGVAYPCCHLAQSRDRDGRANPDLHRLAATPGATGTNNFAAARTHMDNVRRPPEVTD
jgi:hypothetical protein